jgi:hypothetical protein
MKAIGFNPLIEKVNSVFNSVFGIKFNDDKKDPIFILMILDVLYLKMALCKINIQTSMANFINEKIQVNGSIKTAAAEDEDEVSETDDGEDFDVDNLEADIESTFNTYFGGDEDFDYSSNEDEEDDSESDSEEKEVVEEEEDVKESAGEMRTDTFSEPVSDASDSNKLSSTSDNREKLFKILEDMYS